MNFPHDMQPVSRIEHAPGGVDATGHSAPVAARRLHPLVATAAVSVIVLSVTGVAALSGLIGPRHAEAPASATVTPPTVAATGTPPANAPSSVAQPAVLPPAASAVSPVTAAVPPADPATASESAHAGTTPRLAKPTPHRTPHAAVAVMPSQPTLAQGPAASVPPVQAQPPAEPVAVAPAPAIAVAPAPARAADWGIVQSVREVKIDAQPSAVGTVAGGLLGAVLGHQMGAGHGRDVGTVLGGLGGVLAGRAIESKARASSHWEMTVLLDDGSTRTFNRGTPWAFQPGERVHLVDGHPTGPAS
jgi:outer membrane lipoprotein SlyB